MLWKQLAYLIEYHNSRGLAVIAYAERADSCERHKKVLVEHLSVSDIAYSVPQHIVAYHEIGRNVEQQRFPTLEA